MKKTTLMQKTRRIIVKSIILSLIAFLISCLLYGLLGKYLIYIGVDSKNVSYIQEYYKNRNRTDSTYFESKNIQVLCVDEYTNRNNLADLIDTLCKYKPSVIGIDIIFPPKDNKTDSIDLKLKNTIVKNADKIVLAQAFKKAELMQSIFENDAALQFGLIHSYDAINFPCKMSFEGLDYKFFAYAIAEMFYNNKGKKIDQIIDFDIFVVNYSNTDIDYENISNFMDEPSDIKNDIEGKVVLIGALDDPFDSYPTPFIIENKDELPGIIRHAYAINSLISPEVAMKRLPIWTFHNLLIFWLLSLSYVLLYAYLTDKKTKFDGKKKTLFNIIRPIVLIVWVSILLYGCYIYTKSHNIIPNVVLFLITVFIANAFNDSFEQILKSKKYE